MPDHLDLWRQVSFAYLKSYAFRVAFVSISRNDKRGRTIQPPPDHVISLEKILDSFYRVEPSQVCESPFILVLTMTNPLRHLQPFRCCNPARELPSGFQVHAPGAFPTLKRAARRPHKGFVQYFAGEQGRDCGKRIHRA